MIQRLLRPGPPVLDVTPTYWQLRRFCRWQARELRRLARLPHGAAALRTQAREQAAWSDDVLRHHPLRDDLTRTLQQSAALLQALSTSEARPAA